MHYISLASPYIRPDGSPPLSAGRYLTEDATAAEIFSHADRGSVTVDTFWKSTEPKDGPNILLISNGGFGDCIMLTPALRAFREKYPQHKLTLATRQRVHQVFDNLPYAPALIDYPVPSGVADTFDLILTTENLQESAVVGREKHAIDIKADVLGVAPLENRMCDFVLTDEERHWAIGRHNRILHPEEKRVTPRIGIHMSASSPIRDYHPRLMTQVAQSLYEDGYEVILFGTAKDRGDGNDSNFVPEKYRDRLVNLVPENYTFRQSAAVLATCDALVCPDSAFVHLGGALRIPTIALFAVVPWELRTKYHPTVRAITGHCGISPCMHHPRHLTDYWPAGGPCVKDGYCTALASITPERVAREVEKVLGK